MSSVYQPKRKELAKVKIVSSQKYSENRGEYHLVGSISRKHTNFVTTQRNRKTGKCSFIEDTSALTKKSKNEIVRFFSDKKNDRKDVAYLVLPQSAKTQETNKAKNPKGKK